jgi:hypothetical protein
MSAKDKSEPSSFELEKSELQQLLRISERAQGVVAECNRVLAARYENLTKESPEEAERVRLMS